MCEKRKKKKKKKGAAGLVGLLHLWASSRLLSVSQYNYCIMTGAGAGCWKDCVQYTKYIVTGEAWARGACHNTLRCIVIG